MFGRGFYGFVEIMHFKVKSTVSKMYGLKHPNTDTHARRSH